MTRNDLTDMLTAHFYPDFANIMAQEVVSHCAVDLIYEFAVTGCELPKATRDKLIFRAAYTLEAIFFHHREKFNPYIDRFFQDFTLCTNSSAKRHFTKIMAHLLTEQTPTATQCESIAERCAEWAVDDKLRVAPKIWAVEVLFLLRSEVTWIDETLPEIVELLKRESLPSLDCRIKRWKDVRIV